MSSIDLTQEEERLIALARTLTSPSNFSLETELRQMKKARVIGVSSTYRHTYFYHRARIEPLYEGREAIDVGEDRGQKYHQVLEKVMRHLQ